MYTVKKMAEVTISARIPKDLEKELEEFMEKEKIDRSIAIRKLLLLALQEWREKTALKLLEQGGATFSKAAKIAGLDLWTFAEKVMRSDITWIKIHPERMRKELKL